MASGTVIRVAGMASQRSLKLAPNELEFRVVRCNERLGATFSGVVRIPNSAGELRRPIAPGHDAIQGEAQGLTSADAGPFVEPVAFRATAGLGNRVGGSRPA